MSSDISFFFSAVKNETSKAEKNSVLRPRARDFHYSVYIPFLEEKFSMGFLK